MARDWDATLEGWSVGPGKAEQEKLENAETAIRNAVASSATLRGRQIRVFAKGSYANRTNVRQESDVDVCLLYEGAFYYDLAQEVAARDVGISGTAADYTFPAFKNDADAALRTYFGTAGVVRGKKAFDIHENTYRVSADAVPSFEYHFYWGKSPASFYKGTCFYPDGAAARTLNWPEQQYANGVAKNDRTGRRAKAVTRVLKNLRNEMADRRIAPAQPMPSFLLECLVYRTPDNLFGNERLYDDLRNVIQDNWNGTATDESCKKWTEVSERKWLFNAGQPWTRVQVREFLLAAWQYVGYT